ncbi:unnamed protein product [Anthophora retusa]
MPDRRTINVAILLAVVLLFDKCSGYPSIRQEVESQCKGCGDFCEKCEFGWVMSNVCNIPICAKGPDQSCGGPRGVHGICGEGMYCRCKKCSGCSSKTLACSKLPPCLPPNTNRFGRLSITTVA